MDGRDERAFALRGLVRHLLPMAFALSFQGGFAVAVMLLDRADGALPSDALYVALVEAVVAVVVLGVVSVRVLMTKLQLARALRLPLDSELPRAMPGVEEGWKALLEAARSDARSEIARREAVAKAEMDAFIASVHALKTPATALSLMAQRAIADGTPMPPEETRLEIDELGRALDRALGRLRLGDFEAGSRIVRVDAVLAVRESLKRHRRLFISRGLAADVEGDLAVETDAFWLSFILDQLLSNAAKYATTRVTIGLARNGETGTVTVADDGPGFDPEDRLRAFGKSASGSAGARSRPDAGPSASGYGLYLAAEAARRLGVELELEAGGGAVARLTLPLARDSLD